MEKTKRGRRLTPHQSKGSQTEAVIVPLPRIASQPLTPWTVAAIVKARAADTGFGGRDYGGHSLKRGELTASMECGIPPSGLKRLGRHKSFDVLGEYLELGDLFDRHPLGGVL